MKKKIILTGCLLSITLCQVFAQIYSDKKIGKNKPHLDSLQEFEYPYLLPIWGEKVAKLGFELPYSAGIGLNFISQQSEIVIDNLHVGFNDGPMHDLDGIVRFDDAISTTTGVNFRPDIWLFPFLNIYGILLTSNIATEVDFTVTVPTGDSYRDILSASTVANFEGSTAGFGLTPTIGVGGGWMAFDMNFTWTDIEALATPAYAFVFAPRIGKSFNFKKKHRTIAIWVGAFRVSINTGTEGSLALNELFSFDELDDNIQDGYSGLEESKIELDNWWNNLTQMEQEQSSNQAKYEISNNAINRAGAFLGNLDLASSNLEQTTVQYTLDKKQKNPWNMVAGSQFQYNKHLMLRFEVGFLGTRSQYLLGLQYRFGL